MLIDKINQNDKIIKINKKSIIRIIFNSDLSQETLNLKLLMKGPAETQEDFYITLLTNGESQARIPLNYNLSEHSLSKLNNKDHLELQPYPQPPRGPKPPPESCPQSITWIDPNLDQGVT